MTRSRREFLAKGTAGVGAALLAIAGASRLGPSGFAVGGGGGTSIRSYRWGALRPVPGGITISVEDSDGYGTLAGGLEDADGTPLAATNRHVVDPEYPDSDEEDVLGTAVYQPDGEESDERIGEVVEVGKAKGSGASDWALLELDDADDWTGHILGIGTATEATDPTPGDRVVMSGITTGLWGAEVTNVAIDRNWRGTLLEDVIEYRVDEDRDTAGNSGSWVGYVDPDGAFRPVGIHTFASDGWRYAIPADDVLEGADRELELASADDRPEPRDLEGYVDGAIGKITDGAATVAVGNTGGERVRDRTIELVNEDGERTDAADVTLDPFDVRRLELEASERPELRTGDVTVETIEL